MDSIRIPLPDLQGARTTVQGKHGEVVFSASAYDVPRFMVVDLDKPHRRLLINFEYIGTEESTKKKLDQDFEVTIGIHSGKLIGIELTNLAQQPRELTLRLTGVLRHQAEIAPRRNQRLNYETIRQVLESHSSDMFAST